MIESEIVRIPAERRKAIIGKEGKTKAQIEKMCKVKLKIDDEGEITISGDPTEVFFAKDVVKAIGRGFEPKTALKLLKDDYNLQLINLKEIANNEKAMVRLKGRVIGESGKIRLDIESATDSFLCIYGSTIGIISHVDTISYATEAVNMLLEGAPHPAVLRYLAKAKHEIMDKRLRS